MIKNSVLLLAGWVAVLAATGNAQVTSPGDQTDTKSAVPDKSKSAEPAPAELRWQTPFSPISGRASKSNFVVMLITNDDPYAKASTDDVAPRIWCDSLFTAAYRKTLQRRPDLKEKLILQKLPAGLPEYLTTVAPRNHPARAMTLVTDSQYRLMSIMVGVPDSDDLVTLLEDAQDTALTTQLCQGDRNKTIRQIAQRSLERVSRQWQTTLNQMVENLDGDVGDEGSVSETTASIESHLGRVGETLDQMYFADVRLRFAFSESADLLRLAILEQHSQTRAPWCHAIMPFLAGRDLRETWRPIAEMVWKQPTVTDVFSDREFIDWWAAKKKIGTVVLALEPPFLIKQQKWPPVLVGVTNKKLDWLALEKEMANHAFRTVNAQQLTVLLRDRKLDPVEINGPSRVRYVLFDARQSKPIPIHESDLPAKFIGRLKRK